MSIPRFRRRGTHPAPKLQDFVYTGRQSLEGDHMKRRFLSLLVVLAFAARRRGRAGRADRNPDRHSEVDRRRRDCRCRRGRHVAGAAGRANGRHRRERRLLAAELAARNLHGPVCERRPQPRGADRAAAARRHRVGRRDAVGRAGRLRRCSSKASSPPAVTSTQTSANITAGEVNALPMGRTPYLIAELMPGLTTNTPSRESADDFRRLRVRQRVPRRRRRRERQPARDR